VSDGESQQNPQTVMGGLSRAEVFLLGLTLGMILCIVLLAVFSNGSIYADPCQGSEVCI
jgi:hypothetical protein